MTKLKLEKGTDRIENLKIFLIQATTIEFQRSKQGKTASLGLESKHFSFYGEIEFPDIGSPFVPNNRCPIRIFPETP